MLLIRTLCVSALLALAVAGPAGAADAVSGGVPTPCDATHTVASGPVSVASGAECRLTNTQAVTNITVAPGGFLGLEASTVQSVNSQGQVKITNSTVTGRLTVTNTAYEASTVICNTTVGGTALFQNNAGVVLSAPVVCVAGDTFKSSVRVIGNLDTEFDSGRIEGDLICHYNTPKPVVTNMTVVGVRSGQCAR